MSVAHLQHLLEVGAGDEFVNAQSQEPHISLRYGDKVVPMNIGVAAGEAFVPFHATLVKHFLRAVVAALVKDVYPLGKREPVVKPLRQPCGFVVDDGAYLNRQGLSSTRHVHPPHGSPALQGGFPRNHLFLPPAYILSFRKLNVEE